MFVLPAFDHMEIIPDSQLSADHLSFPTNKNEVTKMYEDDVMPQFRSHKYRKGHNSTNYSKWIGNNTKASYPIKYEYGYEPYVIGAKKHIPRFYDFFRGYGINKVSWVTEIHLAGYKFEVLRDYYIFHAKHTSSYNSTDKRRQLKQNALFETFYERGGKQIWRVCRS